MYIWPGGGVTYTDDHFSLEMPTTFTGDFCYSYFPPGSFDFLNDPAEDIYDLDDGEAIE